MFTPLIALLRPVSPLAWLPIGLLLFQKAEPASSWTIFICSIWPMVINTAEGCEGSHRTTSTWRAYCSFQSGR